MECRNLLIYTFGYAYYNVILSMYGNPFRFMKFIGWIDYIPWSCKMWGSYITLQRKTIFTEKKIIIICWKVNNFIMYFILINISANLFLVIPPFRDFFEAIPSVFAYFHVKHQQLLSILGCLSNPLLQYKSIG